MTDIRDLTDEDDVAFALGSSATRASPAVPGSSFFSRPELGRTKLRFAFPKRPETLEAAAERLARLAAASDVSRSSGRRRRPSRRPRAIARRASGVS